MPKQSQYRITTDGTLFRVEKLYPSIDSTKDLVWVVVSEEMSSLAHAQLALDRAKNPPVWRPVSPA